MPTIEVRETTSQQQIQTAFKIREQVFVIEQNVSPEEEYDAYETTSHHYLAYCDGVPCGTARWRKTENGVKLERFAVLKNYRNLQAGSAILRLITADVLEREPNKTVYLHAQLPAIRFYERHGFEKVGEMFSECDIDHYKMVLKT